MRSPTAPGGGPPDETLVERLRALSLRRRRALADRLQRLLPPSEPNRPGTQSSGPADVSRPGTLDAYVVFRDGSDDGIDELREFVRRELPAYMVPSSFVRLEALPRGPTGKVDRHALPLAAPGRHDDDVFVPPESNDEIALGEIWSEVLGVDRVGLHDNFFEIGGHSLLAVQLLSRIRAVFDVELPLDALFDAPTVSGILERVDTLRWAGGEKHGERSPVDLDEDVEEFSV